MNSTHAPPTPTPTTTSIPSTKRLALFVGDVRVDVVLDEYSDDVVTAQFAGVAEGRPPRVVLDVHVSTLAQQKVNSLGPCLFLLWWEIREGIVLYVYVADPRPKLMPLLLY